MAIGRPLNLSVGLILDRVAASTRQRAGVAFAIAACSWQSDHWRVALPAHPDAQGGMALEWQMHAPDASEVEGSR